MNTASRRGAAPRLNFTLTSEKSRRRAAVSNPRAAVSGSARKTSNVYLFIYFVALISPLIVLHRLPRIGKKKRDQRLERVQSTPHQ